MMARTVTVTPEITKLIEVAAEISEAVINVDAETITAVRTYTEPVEYYEGEYEFTPSQSPQTVQIKDKMTRHDITINPIPSNYGLITWNGATLTVS